MLQDPVTLWFMFFFWVLKWWIVIKASKHLGLIKEETHADRYRFMSQLLRSYEDKNRRSDYSRGKYYMHEIPKGMRDDELIMNDVIDFEQAFK